MSTSVSIASQALLLIRANPINSFSDDSNEAEIVKVLYEPHIKHLLSIYPWTFATKKLQLIQDTVAPLNEYKYSHVLPADVLLVWAMFNSNLTGASPISDFDIYGTGTARRVFSNYPSLYADYVFRADEATWPAYFEQFAINSLASVLALPVTGNAEFMNIYDQLAYGTVGSNKKGGLFGVAASMESKQKRNEYIVSAPLAAARFS